MRAYVIWAAGSRALTTSAWMAPPPLSNEVAGAKNSTVMTTPGNFTFLIEYNSLFNVTNTSTIHHFVGFRTKGLDYFHPGVSAKKNFNFDDILFTTTIIIYHLSCKWKVINSKVHFITKVWETIRLGKWLSFMWKRVHDMSFFSSILHWWLWYNIYTSITNLPMVFFD